MTEQLTTLPFVSIRNEGSNDNVTLEVKVSAQAKLDSGLGLKVRRELR